MAAVAPTPETAIPTPWAGRTQTRCMTPRRVPAIVAGPSRKYSRRSIATPGCGIEAAAAIRPALFPVCRHCVRFHTRRDPRVLRNLLVRHPFNGAQAAASPGALSLGLTGRLQARNKWLELVKETRSEATCHFAFDRSVRTDMPILHSFTFVLPGTSHTVIFDRLFTLMSSPMTYHSRSSRTVYSMYIHACGRGPLALTNSLSCYFFSIHAPFLVSSHPHTSRQLSLPRLATCNSSAVHTRAHDNPMTLLNHELVRT